MAQHSQHRISLSDSSRGFCSAESAQLGAFNPGADSFAEAAIERFSISALRISIQPDWGGRGKPRPRTGGGEPPHSQKKRASLRSQIQRRS